MLNWLYDNFGGGKTIRMYQTANRIYQRQLYHQQEENIRLVYENSILKCRVKELEAGVHIDDNETLMEFTHVNFETE